MKSSKQIISYILDRPYFAPLNKQICYAKFIHMLPERFQKAIAFVYLKNETFFIALSHPGYKMEFNYNKELFKGLLDTLTKGATECSWIKADKIVIFNSKIKTVEKKESGNTVPYYSELSTGNFEMKEADENIAKIFSEIKKNIKINLHTSRQ